jgi:hypothetical protein
LNIFLNIFKLSLKLCKNLPLKVIEEFENWKKSLFLASDGAKYITGHVLNQPAASPVHYTTSCKHSLVLLRMGEIIARIMLS